MRSSQIFKEVDVTVLKFDPSLLKTHKHPFFQIIYILEGDGIHIINNNRYPFNKGSLYLITPGDMHRYEPARSPVFCVIDFTKSFFNKPVNSRDDKMNFSESFKRLEYIFHNQHNVSGSLLSDSTNPIFEVLINQLITEKQTDPSGGNIITQNIIFYYLT
jgi:AraC family L-rhamnose operon regulatory protein RhaS